MENCILRNNVNAETQAMYGVKEGVIYRAEDGEHEKEGKVLVHLTAPDGAKIEIPLNFVVFLPLTRSSELDDPT